MQDFPWPFFRQIWQSPVNLHPVINTYKRLRRDGLVRHKIDASSVMLRFRSENIIHILTKAYTLSKIEILKKFVSYPGANVRGPRDFCLSVTENPAATIYIANFVLRNWCFALAKLMLINCWKNLESCGRKWKIMFTFAAIRSGGKWGQDGNWGELQALRNVNW